MPSTMSETELREQLAPYNQEHLLRFWDELDEQQQQQLSEQIRGLDLEYLQRLVGADQAHPEQEDWATLARRAKPPLAFRLNDPNPRFSAEEARRAGEAALAGGKVGVVLVAGGQATRLGFDKPKGLFPIGPVSGATLFQILFEMLVATRRDYQVAMPLYLMTSPATHQPTLDYLDEVDRFGIPEADVRVFCQGTMPAVDYHSGRILLSGKDSIALSPDGHGGVLPALHRQGLFDDMQRRGIEHLFYLQVDNPLVHFCEPEFIGYHLLSQSQASTKVIAKNSPTEKLGNLAEIDGRLSVIEYSDLPEAAADRRDEHGEPVFWAGNLAIHVFDRAFLASMAHGAHQLQFHHAHKKVPYLDEHGQHIEPTEPNAVKFERFIFDVLPAAETAIVVETDRQSEYAGVKNAEGNNSPTSVREQMCDVHRDWLRQAGAEVSDAVEVEISPLFALTPQQLAERLPTGTKVEKATYFRPEE